MKSLTLPESLTIVSVAEWFSMLTAALDAGEPMTLHAQATSRVDAAGIQLLAAFLREAARRGVMVNLSAGNSPLLESARQLGVQEIFLSAVNTTSEA